MGWLAIIDAGQTRETLEALKRRLEEDMPDRLRHHLLDAFATLVLVAGASEFLQDADRLSLELYEARGGEWTVRGTRGSVLIDCGNYNEGCEMLRAVMASQTSDFDKAISASFLALADLRRGLAESATSWLATARDHDPNCAALPRMEALVKAREASHP